MKKYLSSKLSALSVLKNSKIFVKSNFCFDFANDKKTIWMTSLVWAICSFKFISCWQKIIPLIDTSFSLHSHFSNNGDRDIFVGSCFAFLFFSEYCLAVWLVLEKRNQSLKSFFSASPNSGWFANRQFYTTIKLINCGRFGLIIHWIRGHCWYLFDIQFENCW